MKTNSEIHRDEFSIINERVTYINTNLLNYFHYLVLSSFSLNEEFSLKRFSLVSYMFRDMINQNLL